MEALRQLVERIRAQLSVMSRSQQLTIGLCAVVIMGSLLWLTQWSSQPQLEPLLDQPMTTEELTEAAQVLTAVRADYEEIGDRIFVRPDQRRKLLRELNLRDALPKDTTLGFENLLKEQSPFQPESINRRNYLIALQTELAAVIAEDPSVSAARVFINDASQRKLGGRQNLEPTASVRVSSARGNGIDQAKVLGIASIVSGPVAGLDPHRVSVIVDGRPRPLPGPEEELSFGLLEERKKNERHLEEKIHAQLNYIPGVKVAVSVALETTRKEVETREYTDAEIRSDRSKSEESSVGTPAGEAGVNPNTGAALSTAADGQSSSTEEAESEYFEPQIARVERSRQVPLTVRQATASVNIPRSYFVNVFTAENPGSDQPTLNDLKPLIDIEKSRVQASVLKVLGSIDPDDVTVDWFPDLAPDPAAGFADGSGYATAGVGADETPAGLLRQYGPQAGLGLLALFALTMMFRLVRKSNRAIDSLPREIVNSEETEEIRPLESAQASEGYLVGQEVDEDTLRYRELSEQVSHMVEDDPDTAAELIRRWMQEA